VEQRRQQDQAAGDVALVANNAADLFDNPDAWEGGNPQGDITLVEFIDYRCGYCRRAHGDVAELIASDGNIRFIVKELPILGEASMISSRFAIATRLVAGDDAYKAAHDALVTLNSDLNDRTLTRLARTLDLDADAILAEMDSPEVTRIINDTRQLAQRMNISGTPTFVMGNQMLRGYLPLDGMRQVLDQVRAEG
ncbi:MAG: DsbA family protein, partial [Primorskyibacter sp.]